MLFKQIFLHPFCLPASSNGIEEPEGKREACQARELSQEKHDDRNEQESKWSDRNEQKPPKCQQFRTQAG